MLSRHSLHALEPQLLSDRTEREPPVDAVYSGMEVGG